jgi:hypothetical protein
MPYKDPQKRKSYQTKWQKANPIKLAMYARGFKQKVRLEIINLLGGKCVKCGFEDVRALQVDHIKSVGQKNRFRQQYLKQDIVKNPNLYQLLCANCNWIKRHENNETNIKYL